MFETQVLKNGDGPEILTWTGRVSNDPKETAHLLEDDERPLDPKEIETVMTQFTAVTLPQ